MFTSPTAAVPMISSNILCVGEGAVVERAVPPPVLKIFLFLSASVFLAFLFKFSYLSFKFCTFK